MRRSNGFTLIELMMVVAIVAILTAVAVPSYFSHVSKSYRKDAMGALTGFAQAMEREYTTKGTYAQADGDDTDEAAGDDASPTIFPTEAPLDGSNKAYDLVIYAASANSYEIRAVPKDTGRMKDDGIIALKSTGLRGWDRDGDDDPFGSDEQCWDESC